MQKISAKCSVNNLSMSAFVKAREGGEGDLKGSLSLLSGLGLGKYINFKILVLDKNRNIELLTKISKEGGGTCWD